MTDARLHHYAAKIWLTNLNIVITGVSEDCGTIMELRGIEASKRVLADFKAELKPRKPKPKTK